LAERPWHYGSAVVDGQLRYTSKSQIEMANPADSGCLRKWYYDKILHKPRKQTRAAERGTSLHDEIERYEKTGDRSLSSLALKGLHFVPDPGPDLRVEQDIVLRPDSPEPTDKITGALALACAPLRIAGVPVTGRIDLHHFRGTNKGTNSIEDSVDPQGTLEIVDWKSTSDARWIKDAKYLARDTQLSAYAEWAYTVYPNLEHVRLSLGYFVERGGPSRKVTLRVVRDDIQPALEQSAAVLRSIQHAATESDVDHVEANTRACDAYGGCFAREYCKARMHVALENFVGRTRADQILGRQGADVGIIDQMRAKAGQDNPAGQPIVPTFTSGPMPLAATPGSSFGGMSVPPSRTPGTAPPVPGPPQLAATLALTPPAAPAAPALPTPDQLARMKAEEESAQAITMFRTALDKLERYAECTYQGNQLGKPAFGEHAAPLYAAARGYVYQGGGYAGTAGALSGMTVNSAEDLRQLVQQLDDFMAQGQLTAPGAAPATAPVPAPAPSVAPAVLQAQSSVNPTSLVVTTTAALPAITPATEDKKPGKKGKKSAGSVDGITLYVNCSLHGVEAESLQPLVDKWRADLASAVGGTDILFQPNDSIYAFGKWKGAIRDVALRFEIPSGTYQLDARGSEVNEVVVEAIRARAGAVVIRGY
jgi:hypothetical protein